ncbi:MAG: glutathione S-transferase family protein [Pseudomonadota bacterium]
MPARLDPVRADRDLNVDEPMADYRLFGAETSPYSLKVRAFLRYKGADFDWVLRSAATEDEFQRHAVLPAVPLLIGPDGKASQDSTNMLATLEKKISTPAARPDDPACQALALILEDYADEWLNKALFHQRWSQSPDREAAATRLLEQVLSGKTPAKRREAQASVVSRMTERLDLVGATPDNAPVLTASFQRFAELFNAHLEQHLYIFGGQPSSADFALAGQLQQMLRDPTAGTWLRERAPFVAAWCAFMDAPKAGGPFLPLTDLSGTLLPLFRDEIAVTYVPWADANALAITKRRKDVTIDLADGTLTQKPQRYAAKSWRVVKKAVEKLKKSDGLREFMAAAALDALV